MIKNYAPSLDDGKQVLFASLGIDLNVDLTIDRELGIVQAQQTTWEEEEDDYHTSPLSLSKAKKLLDDNDTRYFGIKDGWMTFDQIITRYKYK
jgi:hypothetical protein